jgi:hypothetical protein
VFIQILNMLGEFILLDCRISKSIVRSRVCVVHWQFWEFPLIDLNKTLHGHLVSTFVGDKVNEL